MYANRVLSNAKDRRTPAKPQAFAEWAAHEDDLAPCQLSFADGEDTPQAEKDEVFTAPIEPKPSKVRLVCIDEPKGEACPFNVSDIPSPTRSRAKKQQTLWEAEAESPECEAPKEDQVPPTSIAVRMDDAQAEVPADEAAEKEMARLQEMNRHGGCEM